VSDKPKLSKDERLRRLLQQTQLDAIRSVAGLFKQAGEPGYNVDAEKSWRELRGVTRAALELTKGAMAQERARTNAAAGPKQLGVVVVAPRIESAKQWEELAAQVDAGKPVLDVEAVPVAELTAAESEKKD
jgi:hypothetical protein